MTCIFCQIVEGKAPCHKVWEDEHHLAFLSIFPNTDGFTVVIPKKHYPSYAFDMPPQALADLMMATQKVAKKLDKAFPDVSRTGMAVQAPYPAYKTVLLVGLISISPPGKAN